MAHLGGSAPFEELRKTHEMSIWAELGECSLPTSLVRFHLAREIKTYR